MRVLAVVLAAVAVFQPASAVPSRIVDYGFEVAIPDRFAPCGPGAADHGVGFYLDGKPTKPDDGCAAHPTRRVITIYADPGGGRFEELAKWFCDLEHKNGAARQPPSDLRLGGKASISCRTDLPKGWIDVLVVSECGVPKSAKHSPYACNAWLHTTKGDFESDLNTFRQMLKAVTFFAPPP